MADLLDALKSRHSVRKYQDKEVPRELIEKVIEAGLWAPSGGGRQDSVIIAVTNKTIRDKLSASNAAVAGGTGDPFYGAPIVLIVLADKSAPTYLYDGSLTIGNMLLEASSLGLGSCWIHRAKEEFETPKWQAFLKETGLEGDYEGIGHVIIGYPAVDNLKGAARREGRVFWRE